MKILVVEDEDDVRRHIVRALRKKGYTVEEAADGEEAQKRFGGALHPVVLLDLRMPRVGGIEVLRFIRKRSPSTQVIILTGHGGKQDAIQAVNLHAFRYLEKPPNIADIVAAIEQAADAYAEDVGVSPTPPDEPIPSLESIRDLTAGVPENQSPEGE